MGNVVWPTAVLSQLVEIAETIRVDNPAAAQRMVADLWNAGQSLTSFPNRGRPAPGGSRELATVPPYVIRYRVAGDVVTIMHVRHGSRRPID